MLKPSVDFVDVNIKFMFIINLSCINLAYVNVSNFKRTSLSYRVFIINKRKYKRKMKKKM